MSELIVKASIIEHGLVEQVQGIIYRNPRLFEGEKVVLMADSHPTTGDVNSDSVPVGFTMTLSKGLVPVDFVSADIACGVSGMILKDFVPTPMQLQTLSFLGRDLFPVNRTIISNKISDLGTLGNGNHFIEIGTNGKDTLISVHSGSRGKGGEFFRRHREIAKRHTKEYRHQTRVKELEKIEPSLRQQHLKTLPKLSNLPILDVSKYPQYWDELELMYMHAHNNRFILLQAVRTALNMNKETLDLDFELVESVHNYIDRSGSVPIVRKGSIKASPGDRVIIPINMRDGIIVGTVSKEVGDVNYSLPHGAGRVLSRSKALNTLNMEDFKKDMAGVFSSTVVEETLDESPRAYKPLETILEDISPYLEEYTVFKTIYNYKGV